eukprot:1726855-Karenia_brevis.AAC.1
MANEAAIAGHIHIFSVCLLSNRWWRQCDEWIVKVNRWGPEAVHSASIPAAQLHHVAVWVAAHPGKPRRD